MVQFVVCLSFYKPHLDSPYTSPTPSLHISFSEGLLLPLSPSLSFFQALPGCVCHLPTAWDMGDVSQGPLRSPHQGPEGRTSGPRAPAGQAPCQPPEAAHPQVPADHPDPGFLLVWRPREGAAFLHEEFLACPVSQGTLIFVSCCHTRVREELSRPAGQAMGGRHKGPLRGLHWGGEGRSSGSGLARTDSGLRSDRLVSFTHSDNRGRGDATQ